VRLYKTLGMSSTKKLNITTILFIVILLLGVIGFAVYINNSFSENTQQHTHVETVPFATVS
jgi:ABC-type transporter Mla subunit MlaD